MTSLSPRPTAVSTFDPRAPVLACAISKRQTSRRGTRELTLNIARGHPQPPRRRRFVADLSERSMLLSRKVLRASDRRRGGRPEFLLTE
ncbi:hypothetical protein EVAR_49130_1 [Eumeta japonica]|uniref:Uncharacterized protein n=1 Tax=Eumeta variegata TaxID=151549 RepID=A0A4C1YKC1_EUMVA|nr:hypothetical protein EVAR_49130_1 [Eumeta japonica]